MCYRQKNQNSVHQHKLSSIFGSGLIPQTHKKQMNSTTHVNAKLFLLSQMKNRAPCNMTATRTDVMRSIRNAIDIKLTQNSTRSCYWIVHIVQSNQQQAITETISPALCIIVAQLHNDTHRLLFRLASFVRCAAYQSKRKCSSMTNRWHVNSSIVIRSHTMHCNAQAQYYCIRAASFVPIQSYFMYILIYLEYLHSRWKFSYPHQRIHIQLCTVCSENEKAQFAHILMDNILRTFIRNCNTNKIFFCMFFSKFYACVTCHQQLMEETLCSLCV